MLQSAVEQSDLDRLPPSSEVWDKQAIRELLENWVIWRDAGDWERFATVWHSDGRMIATWFRAEAADFIDGCRKGFDAGIIGLHSLGAISVDIQGTRAVAQSKMQIVQRGAVDGVEVDVTCLGRFVDALENRAGRWGIILRQPVYELDRMTPVDPASVPKLDKGLLETFPIGYRHLAYLQTKVGFSVNKSLPGTRGPEIAALNGRMAAWLSGAEASCLES